MTGKAGTTVIRNASIIDGTGADRYAGSVTFQADRIVAVERDEPVSIPDGAEVIDAGGMVLAPGFIDAHTHYDPQLLWDRLATPVAEHGATTIVTGACSFSLAPVLPETRHIVEGLFRKAEDLRLERYADYVDFKWESFPEYLERVNDGTLGVNVGPMVGHTPLRHYVMGTEAQKRTATDEEIDRMCDVLREACRAGAIGLSMSHLDTDENNVPIGSRWANKQERLALAKVLVEEGRGVVQTNLNFAPDGDAFGDMDELGDISRETGLHVEALGCIVTGMDQPFWQNMLKKTEELQASGADVVLQTLAKPFDNFLQFDANFVMFYMLPVWKEVMALPVEGRIAYFSDRSKRPALAEALEIKKGLTRMVKAEVLEGFTSEVKALEGRMVTDIAEERGETLFDTLLDIALMDDLRTRFALRGWSHSDPEGVAIALNHPYTRVAGGSDGGAHVYQFSTSGDSTWLLSHWVRDHDLMPLEKAVKLLTSVPATEFNIKDRGVIAPGKFADLVIFDPDRIANAPVTREFDLPDGSGRYLNHAIGVEKVFVNGALLVDKGEYTDARTGRLV